MVTEREARDMQTAIELFQASDRVTQEAQFQTELATARIWLDDTIDLTWRRSQAPRLQFTNALKDRQTLEALRETRIRMIVIRQEVKTITERIRTIKVSL